MAFETLHNYYENLVIKEILKTIEAKGQSFDDDYAEDIACVALNRLPSRYVRHHVDLIYYLTSEEKVKIDDAVRSAVAEAFSFVEKHKRN